MIPENIDFLMREGDNPIKEINAIEKEIAVNAYNAVNSSPKWEELGYKRTYNFFHLLRFYESRDPYIIDLMYKYEPYPWYIEMEMTQGICPLRCRMCELRYWNEKKIQLSFEKFKYAMDQFPELKWAGNNALGDPFTNPHCWDIWKYLDDQYVCQELYLSGFLLKPKDMKRFLDMKGLIWLKFSMEGATKKTYEYIREGSNFERVLENIKALDSYKKDYGRYFPEIQFHYIIMKNNIEEAFQFLDLVDSLDIDCSGVYYSRLLHNFPEINDLYTEIPEDLPAKIRAKGQKLGINTFFSLTVAKKPPINECLAWLMPYIFPDGTVISCCCMNEQNRRECQRKTSMGNIFKQNFREIWYGEKYTRLRRKLREGKYKEAHPVCRICNIYERI